MIHVSQELIKKMEIPSRLDVTILRSSILFFPSAPTRTLHSFPALARYPLVLAPLDRERLLIFDFSVSETSISSLFFVVNNRGTSSSTLLYSS